MRLSSGQFWAVFWVLTLLIVGLLAWFIGNLFYTVLWKVLGDWGFPITEQQTAAYVGAHLIPFIVLLALAFGLAALVRHQISHAASSSPPSLGSVEHETHSIEINYGEDAPFERITGKSHLYRLERMLLLEFKNTHPHIALSGCKVEISGIEPYMGMRRPLVLRDNFTLAGGDHVFIPLVTYGESRTSARSVSGDTAIAVCAPDGADPNFLAALPHDVENILTIRGTAIGSAFCEEKIVVWVGAGTRLRIRKYQPDDGQPPFISLEEAIREAHGAARNTDIGLSAEKMNTKGVLTWFAWYYHTRGIPVYGNVRNSTRVEPVLFRNVDIKMENSRLIAKEIHGDLIWENMQVRKTDQARLLGIIQDHARALKG
jgi:hypothetical protein